MRVLILGPYPIHAQAINGGVEAANIAVIDALVKSEQVEKLTILSLSKNKNKIQQIKENDFDIIHIPANKRFSLLKRSSKEISNIKKILDITSYDVVLGQGLDHYGDIATRLGLPSAIIVHGIVLEDIKYFNKSILDIPRKMLLNRMIKSILNKTRALICISHYSERLFSSFLDSIFVVPYPLRSSFSLPYNRIIPVNQTEKRLLYLGNISPLKNIEGLIKAFSLVRNIENESRLILTGRILDSNYWNYILQLIRSNGLSDSVEYLGPIDTETVKIECMKSRAIVHFSHQENFPNSIVEGMALARPIVASDVGGVNELVVDCYNGYLLEDNDILGFSQKITRLLLEPELAKIMGDRGYRKIRNLCDPQKIAYELVNIFESII